MSRAGKPSQKAHVVVARAGCTWEEGGVRADADGFFSKDDQNVLELVTVTGLGTKNR